MTRDEIDVEQLLADTWTPQLAARIADRVVEKSAGRRGYLVRGARRHAAGQLEYGDVLFEDVLRALAEETGVDLEQARHAGSYETMEDVLDVLEQRWADGGDIPAVPVEAEQEATRLLASLSMKAAEAAGCEVDSQPWEPLRAGGRLLVDLEGLGCYLDRFVQYGIDPEERAAIHRLGHLVEP